MALFGKRLRNMDRVEAPGLELFRQLQGEPLTAITFVMDYMQITFNDMRLTLNVWPTLVVDNKDLTLTDLVFEKELRRLIDGTVSSAGISTRTGHGLTIWLDRGEIEIAPFQGDLVGPEIMMLSNMITHEWMVWHEGDPPFVDLP